MTWWCAATNLPWTWEWRAYPGVWLVVLAIAALYFTRYRAGRQHVAWSGGRVATFLVGLFLVWAALDWPIGTLGGGYLASVHSLQWLLLAQFAPPFLIMGVPPEAWEALAARSAGWKAFLHRFAGAVTGLVVFNGIMIVTHVPTIVDFLMASQWGAFLIDVAWLFSGLALWWPVLCPPAVQRISEPARIGYLFAATIVPTVPAAFLTFADHPAYQLYELAPRVNGITAASDQQTAGLIMKGVADPVMWFAMALVFFRWSAMERRADAAEAAARGALFPGAPGR
jgi:putative membrane protein